MFFPRVYYFYVGEPLAKWQRTHAAATFASGSLKNGFDFQDDPCTPEEKRGLLGGMGKSAGVLTKGRPPAELLHRRDMNARDIS